MAAEGYDRPLPLCRLLTAAESGYLFLCAADMPLLRREVADYLSQFICSDYDCYVMTCGGRGQPLCAVYAKGAARIAEERIAAGKYKLAGVLEQARTKYVPLEYSRFDPRVLENVNTPREYARLFAPRVFCVCGHKNSGKTTLVCRLLEAFRRDGYRVAALKHDGHNCFSDTPGSDTARFTEAGAAGSAIFTETRCALLLLTDFRNRYDRNWPSCQCGKTVVNVVCCSYGERG